MTSISQKVFEGPRLWAENDKVTNEQSKAGHKAGISTYKDLVGELMLLVGQAERINVNGKDYIVGVDSLKKYASRHMKNADASWQRMPINEAISTIATFNKIKISVVPQKRTLNFVRDLINKIKGTGAKVDQSRVDRVIKEGSANPNETLSASATATLMSAVDPQTAQEDQKSLLNIARDEKKIRNADQLHVLSARGSVPVGGAAPMETTRTGSAPSSMVGPQQQPNKNQQPAATPISSRRMESLADSSSTQSTSSTRRTSPRRQEPTSTEKPKPSSKPMSQEPTSAQPSASFLKQSPDTIKSMLEGNRKDFTALTAKNKGRVEHSGAFTEESCYSIVYHLAKTSPKSPMEKDAFTAIRSLNSDARNALARAAKNPEFQRMMKDWRVSPERMPLVATQLQQIASAK